MTYKHILIVKPSSLGDIVHTLPTLSALRDRFPDAKISWLVKRQWADLLKNVDALDEIWPVDGSLWGWVSHLPKLRAAGFDLVVDVQGLFRSGVMAWLSGCRTRVGFATGREGSPWFYTHAVPVPSPNMHAVERYLLLAGSLGALTQGPPRFGLAPSLEDRQQISELLSRQGLVSGTPWVAMVPGARWATKRWSVESFASVADRVQKTGSARIGLIGGPEDRQVGREVMGLMKTAPLDLVGATGVGLLPALLDSASVLVTNDSGPMHVAAVVGTQVVALFGPTSPSRTGPFGEGHCVLTSGVSCQPCFSRLCHNPIQKECLSRIDPASVTERVETALSRKLAAPRGYTSGKNAAHV